MTFEEEKQLKEQNNNQFPEYIEIATGP